MPPKPKYSRQEIVQAAFDLVRERGAEALTARELAKCIGTSSRPIFTAFENMNELKIAVVDKCEKMFLEYVAHEKKEDKYPEYKAMGMAYIRLAKEEKNIFKLLYMRDRTAEEITDSSIFTNATDVVQDSLKLERPTAERLHTEIWIWVHGVASMLATSYLDLEYGVISDMLTDVYTSLKGRYINE